MSPVILVQEVSSKKGWIYQLIINSYPNPPSQLQQEARILPKVAKCLKQKQNHLILVRKLVFLVIDVKRLYQH